MSGLRPARHPPAGESYTWLPDSVRNSATEVNQVRTIHYVLLLAGLAGIAMIGFSLMGNLPVAADRESQHTMVPTTAPQTSFQTKTPVPTTVTMPIRRATTHEPTMRPETPIPAATPAFTQPSSTAPPSPTGPAGFSLAVSPSRASASRGDVVPYTMLITPEGDFSSPVSLSIDVSVLLFFRQTYDLGTAEPPYPRTLVYQFTVPGNVPSGATIHGVITARGGGVEHQQSLDLTVL